MTATPTLAAGHIRISRTAQGHRVSADVGGSVAWFESPDCLLEPSAEAWGSAFLIPALARGAQLVLPGAISPTWLSNVTRLLPVLHEWWAHPMIPPSANLGQDAGPAGESRGATALCFSGGVDSFYSLLDGGVPIRALVFVHGLDIPLADVTRAAAAESSFREVARARGLDSLLLRTNLREHPVFREASWEQAHGGALAAIGHVLAAEVRRLVVSSSYPYANDRPWGSHWRTDPLWSSSRLEVVHVGASRWRDEKVRAIVADPLVRRHLRVCWENAASTGNCSRCDKCVSTMLMLESCGWLAACPAFELRGPLPRLIDGVPRTVWVKHYERLLAAGLDRETARAVRQLLARSGPSARLTRLRRAIGRRLPAVVRRALSV